MTGNEYFEERTVNNIERAINNINRTEQKEVVRKFLIYLATQGIMTKTRENYAEKIKMFLNKMDKEITDITFDDYVNYLGSQLNKSSSYQVQIYAALKKFAEYLQMAHITEYNNMEGVKKPRNKESIETKEKREHNYLTKTELDQFLMNIKTGKSKYERKVDNSVRDYALFQLMINTGLRISAIVKLDISSINKEDKTLKVVEKRGKIRFCCLSKKLMKLIEDWLEVREKEYNPIDDALFITRKGTRLTNRGIDKLVSKYGDGIKDIRMTPHKIRATYGTILYEKTGDIYFTQKAMGHANIQTTMLYVRGQDEKTQRKAAEIMTELTF